MLPDTSAHSTETDQEAADLLAKWNAEHTDAETDDEGLGDDEALDMDDLYAKYRRDHVYVTNNAVDHIVLGTNDLNQAMDDFEIMTGGIRPLGITSVNGLGTACARMAFGSIENKDDATCTYLEIIGPDPKQASTDLSDKLSQLEPGRLVPVHYAVRSTQALENMKKNSLNKEGGISYDKITLVDTDNGIPVMHDFYIVEEHQEGGLVPSFVSWPEPKDDDDDDDVCRHPAAKLPVVGTLDSVKIALNAQNQDATRANHPVHQILDDVDSNIAIVEVGLADEEDDIVATENGSTLTFTMTTTEGKTLKFSTSNPMGISFPKQGGLELKKPTFQ